MIDRVYVLYTVLYDASDLFESLVRPHGADCVALHQHVAACEQLDGLEGAAIGTDETLTTLDELLL